MADFGLLGANGAFMSNLLDLRQRRHDVIAANVANADTPGYKAQRLNFEDELSATLSVPGELSMARTSRQHMPIPLGEPAQGELESVETPIPKKDGNSVDLEQEMARQSANQILYNYATQAVSGHITKLRMVIDGGTGG